MAVGVVHDLERRHRLPPPSRRPVRPQWPAGACAFKPPHIAGHFRLSCRPRPVPSTHRFLPESTAGPEGRGQPDLGQSIAMAVHFLAIARRTSAMAIAKHCGHIEPQSVAAALVARSLWINHMLRRARSMEFSYDVTTPLNCVNGLDHVPRDDWEARLCRHWPRARQDVTLGRRIQDARCRTAVLEALTAGQLVFGENRVQEAAGKFPALASRPSRVAPAPDRAAADQQGSGRTRRGRRDRDAGPAAPGRRACRRPGPGPEALPHLLVQVNVGEEPQKAGIAPKDRRRLHPRLPGPVRRSAGRA